MLPEFLVSVAVVLSSLVLSTSATPASKSPYRGFKKLKYVFSFGDSYTQTGFNLTNGSPLPSAGNPMGNPPWPGWTSSNGPNWIGYLTTTYNASTLLTYNMAYGGATIDSALVKPWRDDVLSLKNQIEDLFLKHLGSHPATTPWRSDNSLFTIFIGINDVGNSYWLGDFDNFHNHLMDVYFGLVDKLYSTGARNFLFINVPPVNRSPLTVAQGDSAITTEKEALTSYNSKLVERVATLRKDKTKAKSPVWARVFNYSTLFNNILDNGHHYGLKNTTGFCDKYQSGTPAWDTFDPVCGVRVDEYFWLNSLHPGYKVNKAFAKELSKFLKQEGK